MINNILNFSLKNKLIVILFTLTVVGYGTYAIFHIPVGAVPDITNNQIQVITVSSNLSTQDVEQFITYPVELEMSNLPGVEEIRSISKFGLSVVTIVFEDRMGTYLPRQLIAEKIKNAASNIPEGFGEPEMGPITTGLGEIYQYILDVKDEYKDKYTPMELRTIQDWVVKRQLSGIPGVVEVNTWGGYLKQYEISINPQILKSYNLNILEIYDAVTKNNSLAGGAYIEKQDVSYFIRGDGMVKSLADIKNIVVKNINDKPVLIRDIADVKFGHANRYGAITANGEGEKVLGQIMMLKDANSKEVINSVKQRVEEVQKSLPAGVFINPILERSELIGKTSFTIVENLLLGCIIVIFIVILLLGNIRSALVIASIIPLALLFTISMMYIFGVDANLMSLGALDFGIIIDGAVIIVEFIALKMNKSYDVYYTSDKTNRKILKDSIAFEGSTKMIKSAIFGQIIILIVLIPILVLNGVEGKMFRPMALSFSFAILGAMVFGFTWLPVASALFLKPVKEKKKTLSGYIMKIIYLSYLPVIKWSYNHKKIIFSLAIASLILSGFLFNKIGGEFVPTLDEGDFVIQPVFKTGTSLSKTIELTTKMENILKDGFPDEIDQIVSRIGAAEVPTDPMSMEEVDVIIKLRPKNNWVKASTKENLANKFKESLSVLPNIEYEFTQPIEMRFNELITGVRSDIAIKVFGEDLDYLNKKALQIKKLVEDIPGAADVILEKTAGLPQMIVNYNWDKIARYGLNTEELNKQLTMAFGGAIAGKVFEGEKRFDIAVRFDKNFRKDIENIRQINISLPNGSQIPLTEVAKIDYSSGPARISRDDAHRRVVVSVNVRNRDLESVVKDIEKKIDDELELMPGYYVDYGGQFENLKNATNRLSLAVPVSLLLIFIFLHFAFKSLKEATLIFTAVPLSAVGGVLFLWLRGMPFSVSAGIGFIALFGVAVLNGIVLIEYLKELKQQGITDTRELVIKATTGRLRPVLLTAAAAALGFLPMAISTSAGAEVQRPLATVVIGGLITSTLLTMIALPLLYAVLINIEGVKLFPPKLIRKSMIITVPLIFIFGFNANSQSKSLSLEDAIQVGISNNSELKSYHLDAQKTLALIPTAYDFNPTSFSYEYDANNIAGNGYPLSVISVEQSFKLPKYYKTRKKFNELNYNISSVKYQIKKKELEKTISIQYLEVVYLENMKKYLDKLDSIYNKLLIAVNRKFELGEISEIEKLNVFAKKQEIELKKNQLQLEINISLDKFNSVLQSDTVYYVKFQSLKPMDYEIDSTQENIFITYLNRLSNLELQKLKIEKNKLLPDFSLGLFTGTNIQKDSRFYNGISLGMGVPILRKDKNAKIKAMEISLESLNEKNKDFKIKYFNKLNNLKSKLEKYNYAISYYNDFGDMLFKKILNTAQKSYDLGQIDIFKYLQSIETAMNMKMDYYDNLYKRNKKIIELKYFTY